VKCSESFIVGLVIYVGWELLFAKRFFSLFDNQPGHIFAIIEASFVQ
jgi:hypothetical protein